MNSKGFLEQTGTVIEKMSEKRFRVRLDKNNIIIKAARSGHLENYNIKIYVNEKVKVELAHTLDNGRIIRVERQKRTKNQNNESQIIHKKKK